MLGINLVYHPNISVVSPQLYLHFPKRYFTFRGCSHIMSAKNEGVQPPPAPLVGKNQKLAEPPLPPLSEIIFCRIPINNVKPNFLEEIICFEIN